MDQISRQWGEAAPDELPARVQNDLKGAGSSCNDRTLEVFIRRRQWGEAAPGEPPVRTKCGLVEGRGIEPLTSELPESLSGDQPPPVIGQPWLPGD